MKNIGLALFCTLLSLVSFGQSRGASEKFEANLLPSKTGALITYNGEEHAFTVTVEADSVRPADAPGFMYVNGMLVQSSIVTVPAHLYQDSLSEKKQLEILLGYVNYELEYFKKELKINYRDLDIHQGSYNGTPVVVWLFSMPKGNKDIKKQIYISTLRFNQTLTLNMPLMDMKYLEQSLHLLTQLVKTVKEYDRPLDLNKLYKELN